MANVTKKTSKPDLTAGGYDPHDHRNVAKPTNNWETFMHLIKGALGTGILAMPQAMRNAGYLGVLLTVFTTFIVIYGIQVLVRSIYILCKRAQIPQLAYPDAMKLALEGGPERLRCLSPCAKIFVNGFLVAYQIGIGSAYIIFIASNIKSIIEADTDFKVDLRIHMLFYIVPLVLLLLIPDLKWLVPFSMAANVAIIIALGIILYYIFNDFPGAANDREWIGEPLKIPLFFGTCLFALLGLGVILSAEANMKTPKNFTQCFGVFNSSMILVGVLYGIIGVCGYIKYGQATAGTITLNIPTNAIPAQVAKGLYCFAVACSYGLQGFVCCEIVWLNFVPETARNGPKSRLFNVLIRLGFVLLSYLFAEAWTDIGLVISFIGALCLSMLGFCLPALLEICVLRQYPEEYAKIRTNNITLGLLFAFGIIALVIGVGSAILDVVQSF